MSFEHVVKQQYKKHFLTLHGQENYDNVHSDPKIKLVVTSMIYVIGDIFKSCVGVQNAKVPDRRDFFVAQLAAGVLASGSEIDHDLLVKAADALIKRVDHIDVPVTPKEDPNAKV